MGMIDVSGKPVIRRQAKAVGTILLSRGTVHKIQQHQIKKGDPLLAAEIAAMNAAKQTHVLIPHCHQLLLDSVNVTFEISEGMVEVSCYVSAWARTGVEMEALVGVSTALNALWDMVKYLEKDDRGQYPDTKIRDIRVIMKEKIAPEKSNPA